MYLRLGKQYILFCFLLLCGFISKAQLVVNEVSQGASLNKEYAELVVVGSPTCTTVPCFDLRGYYVDDNNGTFATGGGTGIQMGCIHFTNDALWSCIPAGTIIVIYNEADVNANMPAQDLSMSDGNCRLVIPGDNSTLFERHPSLPSIATNTFPTTGFVSTGGWNTTVTLANGGDSFQTRDASGTLLSAVSWGNDNTFDIIYFAGSQSGKVINNLNTTNTNPLNQANWATAVVAGNETPGAPNNAANAAWINSMNFSCGSIIPTALTVSVSSTNTGCACTGSATVTPAGAIAPYTYTWSSGAGNLATANNLCAGNYSVTVSSANGCVQTFTVNIVSTNSVTASISSTNITCHGSNNGAATVTVVNGAAPITYTWSPSGGNNITANNLTIGNYSVTITDANSCTVTATTTINQPSTLSVSIASTNVSCNGGSNGSASVTASGGTSPYTYTWSPSGGNNAIASNLIFGTYTVSISDANQCTKDTQVVITQPPVLTLSLTGTAETCGQKNGTATATASGGTGTLNYTWTPTSGNINTASNLSAGLYSVTVTDALSCSISNTITVQGFVSPVLSVNSTSVLCNGGNTGATTSTITSGGTPAYTYTWAPSGGNNSSANNLTAGNYTLIVTDANGCKDTAFTNISEPTAITSTIISTPATCGNMNGTCVSIVIGGVTPYTYTWSPSGGNNSSASGLASGNYTLNITDINACTYFTSINVGNKPAPIISVTSNSVTCFGASTGSATVAINGGTGTAPFTYTWSPSGGNNPIANNLSVGIYSITVSDSASCTATATLSINQPTPISTTITSTPATCNQSNGTASITVTGGTTAYTYTWAPSGGNNSSATNLTAGNYTVSINDANTCLTTASVSVNQASTVSLSVTSTTSVTCNMGNNGGATVTAIGGTPAYTYTWLPSGTTFINGAASNLISGIYTVSVSDTYSCTATTTVNITQPPALSVIVNNPNICGGVATVLSATVTGGNNAALTYTWAPAGTSTTSTATVNPATTSVYTVSVQNTGCTQIAQATSTVSISPPLTITVTPNDSICNGQSTILAAMASGGGGGTNTYSWNTGASTPSINVAPTTSTIYSVTAHNSNCTTAATATTQVVVYINPTLSITATPTSGCAFICVSFIASANNVTGNSISSYTWNFGDGNSYSAANTGHCYFQSGNYTVSLSATTQKNCGEVLTKPNLVQVHPNPIANFSASTFTTDINDATVYFYDQSIGNITTWSWYIDTTASSIKNPSYTFYSEGTYPVTLIVSDALGCKDTIVKDIIINPEYAFYAPNCITPNGDGRNELFLPEGTGWDNTQYDLWVFDRWGNMITHTTNPNQGWNGTRHNELVQEDTYVWKVALYDIFGRAHEYKGQLSVVR
jgi:gliding motility-associated-like protein